MTPILNFTSGLLTGVSGSSTSGSDTGARQYTFIDGICVGVSDIVPGVAKNTQQFSFINGFLVNVSGSISSGSSSGSIVPPPPGGNIQFITDSGSYVSFYQFYYNAGGQLYPYNLGSGSFVSSSSEIITPSDGNIGQEFSMQFGNLIQLPNSAVGQSGRVVCTLEITNWDDISSDPWTTDYFNEQYTIYFTNLYGAQWVIDNPPPLYKWSHFDLVNSFDVAHFIEPYINGQVVAPVLPSSGESYVTVHGGIITLDPGINYVLPSSLARFYLYTVGYGGWGNQIPYADPPFVMNITGSWHWPEVHYVIHSLTWVPA